MGHMIIDGRKVEFTDEKNILTVIRKAGIDEPSFVKQILIYQPYVTIQNCLYMVPVVYVQLKTRGEKHLPHVLNSQEMEW